jgi:predicted glycosyltransferase
MNILFDIGHPGHVHLLKHSIHILKTKGHSVYITVKDIPVVKRLLESEGLDFIDLGKKKRSILGKAIFQLYYNFKVASIVSKYKIEIGVGSSLTLPQVSRLTKMRSVILDDDDDEVQPFFKVFAYPFADIILTPDVIKRHNNKTFYYPGSHELAYLHPKRFAPDVNVIHKLGLKEEDVFFVLRFVALKGHHDIGQQGISLDQKRSLVNYLKTKGRIFISSEDPVEKEFEKYRLTISPEEIHSLLYYATLFLGDSQTMTSEAAILGTPALKCNTFSGRLSVPNELEDKYKLCYAYTPLQFERFLNHAGELLNQKDIKKEWRLKRNDLIRDKIDVTEFLVWFIENWQVNKERIVVSPEFWKQFK